jgi:site-specific DNA-adenine methylase
MFKMPLSKIKQLPPLVKYPGGKTLVAPLIAEHYDRQLRYVSLFVGGLGDVMAIDPKH